MADRFREIGHRLESPFLDEEILTRRSISDDSAELSNSEIAISAAELACPLDWDADLRLAAYELFDQEKGGGTGGIRLGWQQKKSGEALLIGLELGGDSPKLKAPIPARVRLLEVSGKGKSKTDTTERLVATWHGTLHRNAKTPASARITFELYVSPKNGSRHEGDVLGFDPECIRGADGLVLTFVNREFEIPFPFFVDNRGNRKALEFVAVAEIDEGGKFVELGRSDVLKVPIRRVHEVETTTIFAGRTQKYKGALVGHQILHHESYLLNAATHPAGSTPGQLNTRLVAISPAGVPGLTFERYVSGGLRIVMLNDLLDDLVPSARELMQVLWVPKVVTSKLTPTSVRLMLRSAVSLRLNDLFLDAGFTGMAALWDTDKAASQLVAQFNASFASQGGGAVSRFWKLKNASRPLQVPFWTFFAVLDNVNVGGLGLSEKLQIDQRTTQGGTVYSMASPVPIGSGNKAIQEPIRINSSQLTNHLITEAEDTQRPAHSVRESAAIRFVELVAAQLANAIAHEVAHSLGFMHDVGYEVKGQFSEKLGNSDVSIMSSSAEDSAGASEAVFSDQAKVIWQTAFGVQPTFHPAPLRNKTWTVDEWNTVDWNERRERLRQRYAVDSLTRPAYLRTDVSRIPPFAKAAPKVQKGTHVP